MLKNITPNQDLTINTFITSENDSSDRDFFNKKLLDFTTNNVINDIINGEIYEYKPEIVSEINYNIFFLRYIQSSEVIELQNVIEKEFSEHYNKSVNDFKNRPVSSIYDLGQDNSLREVELPDIFRDKITSLNNSPYFIRDFVSQLRLKNPNKNGIPIFYNSFGLPFYEKKDLWINDNLLFSNKPYLFNSFLLMEFYDTPSSLTQRRIHTTPIFVNPRYNLFEKASDKNFLQERPCFKLTEGSEGFSFFFLDNFYTNEFYVRFSFWDSLSGIKKDLLPSSKQETNKKWLQDPTTFKQELRYLKYTLNYETKIYNIFEYNSNTNNYDLERTNFDLYELEFDEYYKNNIVLNDTPYNAKIESKPPQPESFNPLKFNIKNLVFDYTNTLDYTIKEKLSINNYTNFNTFLDNMASYLDSYRTFVNNNKVNSREFTDFETKIIKIPLIPGEIDSASLTLSNFSATNIDDQSWRIRRIALEDINVVNGTKNFKFNLYNEINSNISDKKKYKLAEAIFESQITERTKNPPYYFTEQLFDDFDIFEDVILAIELSLSGFPVNNTIVAFINDLFNLLKLNKKYYTDNFEFPFSKNYNRVLNSFSFAGYKYVHKGSVYKLDINWNLYNQRGGFIGYSYVNNLGIITEFALIKPVLIKEYNDAKINDIDLYERMKILCKNFMVQFYNTPRTDTVSQGIYDRFGNINKIALDSYFKKFNPLNHQELLETYISLAKKQYINPYFDNNVYTRGDVNSERIRSYSLGLILLLNSDNFLTIREDLKFDLILNIGRYFRHELDLEADINITGKSRISLINNDNDIKNIIIPIDIVVKP
jgi:hypothetical protein